MPNEQWDDFALTREFAAIDQRIGNFEDSMKGLAHFPIDVATAALNIEHLTREVQSIRGEVAGVAHQCEKMREERQAEVDSRRRGRTAIVVAVITGSATVLAALVVLLAQVTG